MQSMHGTGGLTMADLIDRDALLKYMCGACLNPEAQCIQTECYLYREKKRIEAAPAVNRWIPCSERLPYIGVDVIVYVRTWREQKVQFGYRYSEETWSVANIGVPNDEIKFWMPLPEPPEKE
jgi:hypothetical protein